MILTAQYVHYKRCFALARVSSPFRQRHAARWFRYDAYASAPRRLRLICSPRLLFDSDDATYAYFKRGDYYFDVCHDVLDTRYAIYLICHTICARFVACLFTPRHVAIFAIPPFSATCSPSLYAIRSMPRRYSPQYYFILARLFLPLIILTLRLSLRCRHIAACSDIIATISVSIFHTIICLIMSRHIFHVTTRYAVFTDASRQRCVCSICATFLLISRPLRYRCYADFPAYDARSSPALCARTIEIF